MIVLFDGPEKAGKTTIINRIVEMTNAKVRHWGPVADDTEYTYDLMHDAVDDCLWIWDRAWPSEYVYSKLLGRGRRLENDPWLGEWLHGRAIIASGGLRVMVLPMWIHEMKTRRTPDDLPVDPCYELALYKAYADKFDYLTLHNDYDPRSVQYNADRVMRHLKDRTAPANPLPGYAGPQDPAVVVVGDSSDCVTMPGGWLPFTSHLGTQFGRIFGTDAITRMGWTNIGGVNRRLFEGVPVIACGKTAQNWVAGHAPVVLSVPHPAWMYRTKDRSTRNATQAFQSLTQLIKEIRHA